jgi:hypothetical protein
MKEITLAPVESIEDYLARMARQDEQIDGAAHDSDDDSQPPAPPARKEQRLEDEATHEDFHGKTFSNQTHRSVTDPDARLYKKSNGQEAHLRYLVHHVTDVKSGVILSAQASIASGTAERETSLQQLSAIRFAHPQIRIRTLSADKAYGTTDYLQALFTQGIVIGFASQSGTRKGANLPTSNERSGKTTQTAGQNPGNPNPKQSQTNSAHGFLPSCAKVTHSL